ncbi:SDR family oxidoreductase [Paracoccus sp. R12_1]|uniref:SDR family oxidoreductase n=1 Tax=unclassified Paracoccus (in: a-proteobacteria) TaxID=2688777 RepID=UPI001ADCD0DA|nr:MULTISPECIES: SDR family oxidoreductase [unclassified Paracoccus (in: a-proteobacteria)]MBO9454942.1 SDR family oxidoreductase [Paracoccus sp. R12_2]MBO9485370.1 SDR family oxidoreductase [Paracoccus sp. R12_1]
MPSIAITGAGSGIGRATARCFIKAGWRVALIGRRETPLHDTAAGQAALVLPCDVTDAASVDAVFDRMAQEWGRLDVLFNNAGRGATPATPDLMWPEEFRAVIDVNVTGMFLCARAAFRVMRAQNPQGGRIINNGSISAHVPRAGSIAYTASKHAVTGMTRSLSLDGRPFDIACGQIDIGNAGTDLLTQVSRQAANPEPLMDVSVVADAVLHMASLPHGANVQFMTVMATNMPYIGRG